MNFIKVSSLSSNDRSKLKSYWTQQWGAEFSTALVNDFKINAKTKSVEAVKNSFLKLAYNPSSENIKSIEKDLWGQIWPEDYKENSEGSVTASEMQNHIGNTFQYEYKGRTKIGKLEKIDTDERFPDIIFLLFSDPDSPADTTIYPANNNETFTPLNQADTVFDDLDEAKNIMLHVV